MQLAMYRAKARQLLKGNWQKMAALVALWLLVEIVVDSMIEGVFGASSFGYQMLNTFANYFLYFIFLNAVFLGVYKVSQNKPSYYRDTLLLFRQPLYTHLVVLNLVQQVLNWILLLIGLAPFYRLLGWDRVFQFTFNGLDSVAPYLLNISQQGTISETVLLFVTVMLVLSLLQPVILTYYQILVLLKFDLPQAPLKLIFSLSWVILKGNWLKLLGLTLSFIGWELVVYMTAGLGLLWFYPYLIMSVTIFYQEVKAKKVQVIQ
ncbi:DUF975 family protein [Latilactobacillus curvatus]|uniref:DUF975 domain-containing protein n=2 Tax=Latilactobacillus curvatus TaxID=28038 RepID=A0A221RT23_LATCU|nr:DUF975 family protein [Latilactobacillus curvatus]ANJ69788.1 hypothetical protein FBA2_07285 [Latilactobacillus curvatus]AOO75039.1 hypothetical protein LCW_02655 [Latilactobacillus curvatus]ASN59641.1 DUF975 domain-containing protein [Latilactobacillus curvatus]ASN61592.1 DUF975 domain-containing protein [Latilactobacillus curvatus]AWV72501.1 DUF975 family protein [Latilactobacillus curvatus]